ncbi:MAG: hypothetical protein QY332_03345 [Anaerolineales bacterium]|nr:MAG: hypothetical protein QY332_03345 [Anaerolineales bacterium]
MNKSKLKISVSLIGALVITVFWLGQGNNEKFSALPTETNPANLPSNDYSVATWVSNAMSVDQVVLESDLVVKARVSEAPVSRVVRAELPVWDENGNIVGSAIDEMVFSDTVFEVLDTYIGKSSLEIVVMQTGGFEPSISTGVMQMADDPLYNLGEEYILFLNDISGDRVHARDRMLYITVNPFGRYRIDGENVFSYGQNLISHGQFSQLVQLPVNIIELEAQIKQAEQKLNN